MSTTVADSPAFGLAEDKDQEKAAPDSGSLFKPLGHATALVLRLLVGVWLCTQLITSVVVVGWTFRWMRSRTWKGWWKRAGKLAGGSGSGTECFCDFACTLGPDVAGAYSPRWVMAERAGPMWSGPGPGGRAPTAWDRAKRLPAILFGSLAANAAFGAAALVCTMVLTLPGLFLMFAGWEFGWQISFHKGYEDSLIGRSLFVMGMIALAAAMTYVPMAWAHMAAAGDVRAFFQGRLVRRLIRARLGWYTALAAGFVLLNVGWGIAWARVMNLTEEFPWLETASPARLEAFKNGYVLNTAFFVFGAFVFLHLAVARIYQGAVLSVLECEPQWAAELPASVRRGLEALGLIPDGPARRRHPVLAAVIGTTRSARNVVLRVALVLLWLFFAFEMTVMQFLHYHFYYVWLNPVLIHLPCPRWPMWLT